MNSIATPDTSPGPTVGSVAHFLEERLNQLLENNKEAQKLISALIEQRVPVEKDPDELLVHEYSEGKLGFGVLGLINSLLKEATLVAHYEDQDPGTVQWFSVTANPQG